MSLSWSQEYEPEYEVVPVDENGVPVTGLSENSYIPITAIKTRPIARKRPRLELLASTQKPPVSIEQQIEEIATDAVGGVERWCRVAVKYGAVSLPAHVRYLKKLVRQLDRANPAPPTETVKQKDNGQMKLI